ncbi:MAG TPA: M3 family metallopeptidase [Candidatus Tidjanibacter gallistercoris]|nr:M3 family metallopeptidase [Candidatus Tidjanibacter gallistercoris]
MKRTIIPLIVMTLAATACQRDDSAKENPLLTASDKPYGVPQFDKIRPEHYEPAFEQALTEARADIRALAENPEPPTFENTIVALERSGARLNEVATVFFAVQSAETSDEMDAIAERVQPKLIEYSNDIYLNPVIFERVKQVYDDRSAYDLDVQDSMLLDRTYKSFVRGGAGLGEADKERYRAITGELSSLSLKFEQNALAATNAFTLNIPAADSAKVAELPEFVRESMADEATARGEEGWTVTLQQASFGPFMTYSSDRGLKEKLWRAYNTRGIGGDIDNCGNAKRIAELRLELARLFGYPNYAAYVLEEKMAGNVETVDSFIDELLTATKGKALEEVAALQTYAVESGLYGEGFRLMPWDWGYVSEKYKNARYALSNEEIKPYLELENVKQGIFTLAEKLYGITFVPNREIPVYHPDVVAYEVHEADGSLTGIIYMDFFPRATKRGGAWMTNYRPMYTAADGTEVRPIVTLCGNFTKPTSSTPSLLTFDEFETFLHEFGHCLHGLFAEGKYASLTGTAVYQDFVELPSQIMENWATEKEFLDLFAVHYKTGEKMPQELIDKIVASKNYLAAYANVRQLGYALNDMAWHTITEPVATNVEAFERKAMEPAQITPYIEGTAMSPAFTHIFGGGYAAGYYGYKWAEVLEADAFSLFEEQGIFNREVADSFRGNILSRGGSEHPMTLYVRFRGHKPETKALIDKILE